MYSAETTLVFISGLKCHWLHCGLSGKLNQALRKKSFTIITSLDLSLETYFKLSKNVVLSLNKSV